MTQAHTTADCPFCAILRGDAPGTIIARDDEQAFALVRSIHPESSIHWMAMPLEHIGSTEELEQLDQARFMSLIDFAIRHARLQAEDHPDLVSGFTLKLHFGAFETVPHAKIHLLAVE